MVVALSALVASRPRWGLRNCYDRLRPDGQTWNHKRVLRVYCAMNLNLPRRTKRRLPNRIRQPLAAPAILNDIWALDFMADSLYDGRKFRTLNVIDKGTREALWASRWPPQSQRGAWSGCWKNSSRNTTGPVRSAWTTAAS